MSLNSLSPLQCRDVQPLGFVITWRVLTIDTVLDVWLELLQEKLKINGVKQKNPTQPTLPRKKQSRNFIASGPGDDDRPSSKKTSSKKVATQQEELTLKEAIKLNYNTISKFLKELDEVKHLNKKEFQRLHIFGTHPYTSRKFYV